MLPTLFSIRLFVVPIAPVLAATRRGSRRPTCKNAGWLLSVVSSPRNRTSICSGLGIASRCSPPEILAGPEFTSAPVFFSAGRAILATAPAGPAGASAITTSRRTITAGWLSFSTSCSTSATASGGPLTMTLFPIASGTIMARLEGTPGGVALPSARNTWSSVATASAAGIDRRR